MANGEPSDNLAGPDLAMGAHKEGAARRERIIVLHRITGDDLHRLDLRLWVLADLDHAIDFADDGWIFWYAGLKEFFDAGQPLCDIALTAGDTSAMERAHRQLRSRF